MTLRYRDRHEGIEKGFVTWLLGFSMGVMLVLGVDKLFTSPPESTNVEMVRAEKLIEMYKRGGKDALKTNPVSFELEATCLEVWANKQKEPIK